MALSSRSSAQQMENTHKFKWLNGLLLAGLVSVNCGLAMAATPLNDQELDQKFLKADERTAQIDVEEIYRQTQSKNIDQLLMTLIPVSGLSTLTFILNDKDRKQLDNMTEFKFSNSFGELASYEFGSEPYSYRWAGNYDQIYNVFHSQNFYFNTNTGTYEIDNNIKGQVELEVSSFSDNSRTRLYRANYVF